MEKSSPKMWPTFLNFQKQPKVNNHPLGENSPNLVTLIMKQAESKADFDRNVSSSPEEEEKNRICLCALSHVYTPTRVCWRYRVARFFLTQCTKNGGKDTKSPLNYQLDKKCIKWP
jgi:hypothetical protein